MTRALLVALALALPAAATAQADSLVRRLNAAIERYERGDREQALAEFDRFIDVYNNAADELTSQEMAAVAVACTYLGINDPQLFRDALKAFDRAIAIDPNNIDARVKLAELFLDKYNGAEAQSTLAEALRRNPRYVPALVAEARRRDADNLPGADSVLARALELDQDNVAARTLRSRLLADVEDFAGASREIDRALRTDPNDADALAFALALATVRGDSAAHRSYAQRFAARYPNDARAHVAVAELLSRVRQYAMAAEWARLGTTIDPRSWVAHSTLGLNLLRIGDVARARASLETSFGGDPYNVWVKNTLDLMDTFGGYSETTNARFRFMIDTTESRLLSLYLGDLAERAYTTFAQRYQFRPAGLVRVEVYRRHADFSVRTVGLAGLGALGVSFGNTIAFDSPAARDAGVFNWGSTAWHELAHTFTLGASEQRVPRWLSEGLSVFEERRARKGWGQNVSTMFLRAYIDKKTVPPSRLNDGFVRPEFPGQVLLSYYAASLVCELIVRDWGEPALIEMLRAYKEGLNTEQVFQRVLKTNLQAFDVRFDAYIRERFGRTIAALRSPEVEVNAGAPVASLVSQANASRDNYFVQMAVGRALVTQKEMTAAIPILERARALFPENGAADGPYPWLARAQLERGDRKAAAATLGTLVTLGDVPYVLHVQLADLWLQEGDTARAADALEGAMYMNPYEVAQHQRLATLYTRLGDKQKTIRERAAIVALKPVDRADALYQLAVAYHDAGDLANAKKSVLYALEEAPHFERAQELLLVLHEGRP